MTKFTRLAALAAASLLATGAASATPADTDSVQVASATVAFNAEAANTPQGARQLFFRIRQAAEEVCRIASHPVGYELWTQHACENAAVSRAVRASGIPALNERYFGRADSELVAAR